MLLSGFSSLVDLLFLGLLILSIFALVHAALQREDAFRAADKQTKQFWLIILGITVAVLFFLPYFLILSLAGVIATIVYMVDVRPAIQGITGGGGGGFSQGSSSDGPYGPYNGGR